MRVSPARRSGTWLVVAMFCFGIASTVALYVYWNLHTAPFADLAQQIAERFPDSSPRVDGGKPRLDQPGDVILRIVMKVEFDPSDHERTAAFANEVAAFAAEHHDLSTVDAVEVHVFRQHPETELSQATVRIEVEQLGQSTSPPGPEQTSRHD